MKLTPSGVAFLCGFEAYRARPYRDGAGVPTIGFGATHYQGGVPVTMDDPPITRAAAQVLLADSLGDYEAAVSEAVTVPLNQGQFEALVSLCYNIGPRALAKSLLVKAINAGDPEASRRFGAYVHDRAGKIEPGLVARRAAEKRRFDGGAV